MSRFKEIKDKSVVLLSRGVYREVSLFKRDGQVYAKYGAGYIRLYVRAATSVSSVTWYDINLDVRHDKLGRIIHE